jgi:hypothetical protein
VDCHPCSPGRFAPRRHRSNRIAPGTRASSYRFDEWDREP